MSKLIVGNWKMNKTLEEIPEFVKYLKKYGKNQKGLVVCTPSTMITTFKGYAKKLVAVGAQNCHYAPCGAFTGEVSAQMVVDAGADYVIIGHSERREYFDETNDFLDKKVVSAVNAGLKVIYCVGEKLEEKSKYKSVLKTQLLEGLKGVTDFSKIIVAYEPIWAIGTGKTATTSDIEKAHKFIKDTVFEKFGVSVPVLYGGSVKSSNSGEILALDLVDGVLVGGASLKADEFLKIADSRA